MTEDKAKTKWCPFARIIGGKIDAAGASSHRDGQTAFNRIVDEAKWSVPVGGACIGSACMAWRWRTWKMGDGETYSLMMADAPVTPVEGLCGLAGSPR